MKENENPTTFTTSTTDGQQEAIAIAACQFEIDAAQPGKLVQLFPAGQFRATDGRPDDVKVGYWYIDASAAATLIAERQSRTNDLLFDYEHQTLTTQENGKPAPASGWGKNINLVWQDNGLFITDVDWTAAAREAIAKREYRYISPVFTYDKDSGRVIKLLHVAITNFPAIDGMKELIASLTARHEHKNKPQEHSMNEELKWLLTLLGVNVESDIDPAALKQQLNGDDVKVKIAALKSQHGKHTELATQTEDLKTQVAALKAAPAQTPDLSKWVPIENYSAIVSEMAALKSQAQTMTVDQVIEDARKSGKFVAEGELSYLKSLGEQDIAALKSVLDGREAIAALKGEKQSGNVNVENRGTEVAALTEEEKAIADQFGISHTDFEKQLKGDKK